MKSEVNPKNLLKWLLNIANEFEREKASINMAKHIGQEFDEFCLRKINEINEFRYWQNNAKTQLRLFLLGKPSEFDKLINYSENNAFPGAEQL